MGLIKTIDETQDIYTDKHLHYGLIRISKCKRQIWSDKDEKDQNEYQEISKTIGPETRTKNYVHFGYEMMNKEKIEILKIF